MSTCGASDDVRLRRGAAKFATRSAPGVLDSASAERRLRSTSRQAAATCVALLPVFLIDRSAWALPKKEYLPGFLLVCVLVAFDLGFTTRVLTVTGMEEEPGNNKWYNVDCNPGTGTMTAEFDCPADAWFFEGSSNDGFMPYSILMEIALQTCGILTSWNKAPLTF